MMIAFAGRAESAGSDELKTAVTTDAVGEERLGPGVWFLLHVLLFLHASLGNQQLRVTDGPDRPAPSARLASHLYHSEWPVADYLPTRGKPFLLFFVVEDAGPQEKNIQKRPNKPSAATSGLCS